MRSQEDLSLVGRGSLRQPLTIAVAGLAMILLAGACGKSKSSGEDKGGDLAPGTATAPAGKASTEGDQAEQVKLNAAIECLNRHSGRVFEARDSYLSSVDPATGAPGKRTPPMLGLYGVERCVDDVKKAGAVTPAHAELDKASADYVAALQALRGAYDELSAYYQKGEHLDDQGKKAEALHPKAMAAFEAFSGAHQALDGIVRMTNRKHRVADLAAREKAEGRKLEVIIDAMMLEAETLVEQMHAGAPGAALEAQVTAYGKLVDEVDAYAKAHADEVKRGSMANLTNYSRSFLAASKVVTRKRLDGAEPSDREQSEVLEQYNSLVDNYNRR